jgi:glycosyltransferase involved in cell wall biosynthesis
LHLLFFSPAYPPSPGGGERFARSLAQALSERGHNLTFITSVARQEQDYWKPPEQNKHACLMDGSVTVWQCPLKPFPGGGRAVGLLRRAMVLLSPLPGSTALLLRLARLYPPVVDIDAALSQVRQPVDVVHAFNLSWEHLALRGFEHAQNNNLPYILTPFIHLSADGSNRAALPVTMRHQRKLMQEASAVLTLTQEPLDGLSARGISIRQGAVLGGGVDVVPEMKNPEALLERYSLPPSFALFVGRANSGKGATHAALAVQQLRRAGHGASLVLAGRATPEFQDVWKRLDPAVQPFVRFLGSVSETEKHALMAQCDMLLLPSKHDAMGIVMLEAWSHGKPVIGARAGGIPGVVSHGVDGLLVEYGDVDSLAKAMRSLWQQPALRRELGERGRQKVARQYTWERACDVAEATYHELLGG